CTDYHWESVSFSGGALAGQFFADGVADKFGTVGIFLSGPLVQGRQESLWHPNRQQFALWLFPLATLHGMVYIFNLYLCQHFFGLFGGKEVYMSRYAQSARTRSKITAHRRGREIPSGIGRQPGAGRLSEPFAIHPGRHH